MAAEILNNQRQRLCKSCSFSHQWIRPWAFKIVPPPPPEDRGPYYR